MNEIVFHTPRVTTVAGALVEALAGLGVANAFGVSGGAIVPLWAELERSSISVLHFRHESGAAFAAMESYFASGRPCVVFTTTGPGITNAYTGLHAARWEGAKLIFLSPASVSAVRGRWAFQETSSHTFAASDLFAQGSLFHHAVTVESAGQLPGALRHLALGLARPDGFVAHVCVPTDVQSSPAMLSPRAPLARVEAGVSRACARRCAEALTEDGGPIVIWVGFGARGAASAIRRLAERTGAKVMCSPRGKGIFPEDHPQFLGVTGLGGHGAVLEVLARSRPARTLVLGTRLGELTSFYLPELVPPRGFVHVDLDPSVPGAAYPDAEVLAVRADVGAFVEALLEELPERPASAAPATLPAPEIPPPRSAGPVRPEVLMAAIQRVIVDGSDAVLLAEPGNSLIFATHHLRFRTPGRYRTSMGFSSMGHMATGVLGAALGCGGKAVAVVGDGAMLMLSEVSTAVHRGIPAAWIVLNDGGYNMCDQGTKMQGYAGLDTSIPRVDFARLAESVGAAGVTVEREEDLDEALGQALSAAGPFVVDVSIDATRPAPIGGRVARLLAQGAVGRGEG